MTFYTIKRKNISNSLMHVKCLQRCSCADARHSEINGQCTEILPYTNIGRTSTTSPVNISEIFRGNFNGLLIPF